MITDPTANVALTFEQLAQIDTTKSRLSNLENEIVIATKNLSILNKDVIKATKEREYQEELTATLTPKVEALNKNIEELTATKVELEKSSATLTDEMATSKNEHDTRTADLSKREDAVSAREVEAASKLSNLTATKNKLEEDKTVFNAKIVKVREVVSNI